MVCAKKADISSSPEEAMIGEGRTVVRLKCARYWFQTLSASWADWLKEVNPSLRTFGMPSDSCITTVRSRVQDCPSRANPQSEWVERKSRGSKSVLNFIRCEGELFCVLESSATL